MSPLFKINGGVSEQNLGEKKVAGGTVIKNTQNLNTHSTFPGIWADT